MSVLPNNLSLLPTGPVITNPTGIDSNGLPFLSFTPPALTHGGEGGTVQQSAVTLQVMSLAQLLSSGTVGVVNGVASPFVGNGGPQFLSLTSTGKDLPT